MTRIRSNPSALALTANALAPEEECCCRKIGADGKFKSGATNCSDCGVVLKVIDFETGEDVLKGH